MEKKNVIQTNQASVEKSYPHSFRLFFSSVSLESGCHLSRICQRTWSWLKYFKNKHNMLWRDKLKPRWKRRSLKWLQSHFYCFLDLYVDLYWTLIIIETVVNVTGVANLSKYLQEDIEHYSRTWTILDMGRRGQCPCRTGYAPCTQEIILGKAFLFVQYSTL